MSINSLKTVLVADTEPLSRLLLRRVLEKSFGLAVHETASGPEVLLAIESEPPDLIVLADELEIIRGRDVLGAIRASDAFQNLPVVFTSKNAGRELAEAVLRLGVSHFLLKPLDMGVVQDRLGKVLAVVRARKEQLERYGPATGWESDKRALLLIAADVNFRSFADSLLGGTFNVITVETASEAVKAFRDIQPEVVLIDEGLGLFDERLFARTLRVCPGSAGRRFLLVADERYEPTDDDLILFTGVVAKSFVPDTFLAAFNAALYGESAGGGESGGAQGASVRLSLVTAARQVFGVMAGSEITDLGPDEVSVVAREIWASTLLIDRAKAKSLVLDVVASEADVTKIAEAVLRGTIEFSETAREAFEELARSLAGRARAELGSLGVSVEQGDVRMIVNYSDPVEWAAVTVCRLASGEHVLVGLREE